MATNKLTGSFSEAWTTTNHARLWFGILLIVAMLANVGVALGVKLGKVLDPTIRPRLMVPPAAAAVTTAPAKTTAPAGTRYSDSQIELANRFERIFQGTMIATGIVAIVSIVFLVFCALVGLMTLIAGRLPGAGPVASAFFWAVTAVVLLLPWPKLVEQCNYLPTGVPGISQLQGAYELTIVSPEAMTLQVGYWVQFVVYPLILVLIAIMYLGRTSQANTQVSAAMMAQRTDQPTY